MRERVTRSDTETIAVLEARGEKIPERINGMDSSGKQPGVANRIADWNCSVVDGGRKGKHPELGETWIGTSIELVMKLAAVKFGRQPIHL